MAVPRNEGGASSGTVSLYVTEDKTTVKHYNEFEIITIILQIKSNSQVVLTRHGYEAALASASASRSRSF